MGPLLRELTRLVEVFFESLAVIAAQPGPQNQEMCGDQHVDEIQLQHADRVQRPAKVPGIVGHRWPAPVEPLRSERNAPRFGS